jgi:hypothetical protein
MNLENLIESMFLGEVVDDQWHLPEDTSHMTKTEKRLRTMLLNHRRQYRRDCLRWVSLADSIPPADTLFCYYYPDRDEPSFCKLSQKQIADLRKTVTSCPDAMKEILWTILRTPRA